MRISDLLLKEALNKSGSSRVAFLASLSVLPGSAEARRMTVISGQKCSGSYPRFTPIGLLLKMCLESSQWNSPICYLTWKMKATKQQRLIFQLVQQTPRMNGRGSGLWPTPTVNDSKNNGGPSQQRRDGMALNAMATAGLLHTPKAVMVTESPIGFRARINRRRAKDRKDGMPGLASQVAYTLDGHRTGEELQPAFVEWMLGYPIGWTDLES
jgi:hypothetical protein